MGCSDPGSEDEFVPATGHTGELKPILKRLTLSVANDCNLACKYCYANCGRYYSRSSLMDKETALTAVNYAHRRFSRIEHVNFFGGEPTLNLSTIRAVCEYFAYLRDRNRVSQMPRFGLTTNGYALSDQTLRLLEEYDFGISFSLDGPREVHDRLRVSRSGGPTWIAVVDSIEKVRAVGVVPEFECTYTAEHWRMGITVVDLLDFFHRRFGCRVLHCPTVVVPPHSPWFVPLEIAGELYADAIRESVRSIASGEAKSISSVMRMMQAVARGSPIYDFCPAGTGAITVHPDGRVYACFMLMARPEFAIGDVNETKPTRVRDTIIEILEGAGKWRNPECCRCWAQALCFGCIGEDVARGCRKLMCDFRREQVGVFLGQLAEHIPSLRHRSAVRPPCAS